MEERHAFGVDDIASLFASRQIVFFEWVTFGSHPDYGKLR